MFSVRYSLLRSTRSSRWIAKQSNWHEFRQRSQKLRASQPIKTRRQRTTISATSADPSSTSSSQSSEEAGQSYAALHDFCMTIPYGVVIAITGFFGCIAGYGNLAALAALAGSAICVSSYFSLRAWRKGQSNARYTLASAGLATGVGALSWRMIQAGKGKLAGTLMVVLTSAIILFLFYNLASGGNPPKQH